jgi:recombination protein RecT
VKAIQPWKAAVKRLQDNTETLEQDLPGHIDADTMIRSLISAVHGNDKLAYCSVDSILSGVRIAAQLGLVLTPSMGQACLVPYRNRGVYEAQFQPMYQGLMDLAYRTGRVGKITGHAVYEGDHFEYLQGTREFIEHRPGGCADPKKLTHAYAVAWIIGADEPIFVVLNREQVKRAEAMSKAKYDGRPWQTHTEAMWIKTAIKVLAKFIPKGSEDKASVMFAQAVAYDDLGKKGIDRTPKTIDVEQLEDIEPSDEGVDGEVVDGGEQLDRLADNLEKRQPAKKAKPKTKPAKPDTRKGTIHDPDGPPPHDDGDLV